MRVAPAALLLLCLLLPASWARAAGPPRGLDFGLSLEGHPRSAPEVKALEQDLGAPLKVLNVFVQWPADPAAGWFPWPFLDAAAALGVLPCITWEPMFLEQGQERAVPGRDILTGAWDRYLEFFAREARRFGRPLILRLAHEMNLARYHWFTEPGEYGPHSPALYREVFGYVTGKLRAAGAGNVSVAFCPNAESVPGPGNAEGADWNTAAAWWPGAEAVDVLGMDGYNWGTFFRKETHGWDSSWKSFAEIFGPLRAELLGLAPDKPLLVFETASAGLGGDADAWAADAARTAADWGLRALLWFEAKKEQDWRFPRAGRGAAALRSLARSGPAPAESGYK